MASTQLSLPTIKPQERLKTFVLFLIDMPDSGMHNIDPDGDTLLILQHSYAQFAVCDTDERWPNALPQHQSPYSKQQEKSILSSEHAEGGDSVLSGTSSLVKDEPEPKHT